MYQIGIVPSPGIAHEFIKKVIPKVQKLLNQRLEQQTTWQFDIKVDLMIGSAEDTTQSLDKLADLKETHEWDFALGLIDLPNISDHKIVVSDFNNKQQAAYISLPALGGFDVKHKLTNAMTSVIEQLYYNQPKQTLNIHPLIRTKAVKFSEGNENADKEDKQDDEQRDYNRHEHRYVNTVFILAWIQLIMGLTRINQPWKAVFNFKKIVSVAFATGTYVAIFSMPWELSVTYSPLRFILLMFIAIVGMAFWLSYAHQLFERNTAKSQRIYRYVYNTTTLLTLTVITLLNYVALYILLSITVTLFVPAELFDSWTSANGHYMFSNYLKLIWFVASLGLLAGAMGSTVENEEKIRRLTYSYRQYHRYKEAEKEKEEQEERNQASKQDVEKRTSSQND